MEPQIKEVVAVSPKTAAKLAAVIMFGLTAVFLIPMALMFMFIPPHPEPPWPFHLFFLVAPFLYAGFGALFAAFAAWLHNLAAKRLGGLQIAIIDKHDA
ncbi:MAG: hypothetical protein OEO84_01485 [Betaproteobacteria bacterium]|nr:hypothetical protein [Betaproteobacteria bacterium]MDH5536054.1 hypothetical protein [Betaproteobacteria bacterium]